MNITVYGSASDEINKEYIKEGEMIGREIAGHGDSVVFGGGATGMMGAVARGFTEGRSDISQQTDQMLIGVAPDVFDVDGALYDQCDEFLRPDTMRERKRIMEDKADVFLITPGGIGTLDEFFEILVLTEIGHQKKPIILYNMQDYYKDVIGLIDNMIENGFLAPEKRNLFGIVNKPAELFDILESLQYNQ
ncbi:MAG: TIGR00730 family Rossman fold protein [Lachnospiraceae bacterium]|nr:TIGR00730 family Rossman fold protein [Lachnospiraceae bacterium]